MSNRLELKGDQIPDYWKKVLEENKNQPGIEDIGVWEEFGATTLIHRPTGSFLMASIVTEERALVRYYSNEPRARESKPDLDLCDTVYQCGPVVLHLDGILEPKKWS